MYIDELFIRLQKSGYGCYIGCLFAGCFGYADDALLIAPSICSLKLMLNIVDNYGEEYSVKFNPDKCKLISYCQSNTKSIDGIYYNNVYIASESSATHVGNLIGPNLKNQDINEVTNKFILSVNYVLSVFSHCHASVKYRLFKTYCMPLYGSILWDFSSDRIDYFFTQWRKSVRRVWGLSNMTHSNLLHLICQDNTIDIQLHRRFVKFHSSLCKSMNTYVNICVNMALNGSSSSYSNSVNRIALIYHVDKHKLNGCKSIKRSDDEVVNLMTAGNIVDLCHIRDTGQSSLRRSEIDFLLLYLCTQ